MFPKRRWGRHHPRFNPARIVYPVCLPAEFPALQAVVPAFGAFTFDEYVTHIETEAGSASAAGIRIDVGFVSPDHFTGKGAATPLAAARLAEHAPRRRVHGTIHGLIFLEEATRAVNNVLTPSDADVTMRTVARLLDVATAHIALSAMLTVAYFNPTISHQARNATVHLTRDRAGLIQTGDPTHLDLLAAALVAGMTFGGVAVLRSHDPDGPHHTVRMWDLRDARYRPMPGPTTQRVLPNEPPGTRFADT